MRICERNRKFMFPLWMRVATKLRQEKESPGWHLRRICGPFFFDATCFFMAKSRFD